jgi:hypothetical protein
MSDNYVVVVKVFPHSVWSMAEGQELDRETAMHEKATMSDGRYAAIAIARLEEVMIRNPAMPYQVHGD